MTKYRGFITAAAALVLAILIMMAWFGEDFPSGLPKHRIGIRVVNGVGEFYERSTGKTFVPRGNNYIRLSGEPTGAGYHSTFDPGVYDHNRAATALAQMHGDGYNVVRAFLNNEKIGTPTGGLSTAYLANVADFVKLGSQYQIYTILTQDWLPGGKYQEILNQECCALFSDANLLRLSRAGMKAFQQYYADLIPGLSQQGTPTDWIFSYELANELYYARTLPPLSLTSGTVIGVNSKGYDMSSLAGKEAMITETMPYWINGVRGTIRQKDPTALVSVGFMETWKLDEGNDVVSMAWPAIWSSMADFIDLHPYRLPLKPDDAASALGKQVDGFGMAGMQEKPILMGEFGAQKNFFTANEAALVLAAWQVASCPYGFDGWLLWTWDLQTAGPDFTHYWNALDGSGAINAAIAPKNRPNPCSWE
jgi:hypothetical protein